MMLPKPGKLDLNHLLGGIYLLFKLRIGSAKKDDGYRELERRNVPGPGMYELKSTLSGPLYR